jgi:hypothetical protein
MRRFRGFRGLRRFRRFRGFRGRLVRRPTSLLVRAVALLVDAGGRRRRFEPVYDDAAGDAGEDKRAREQNRSDHAQTVEDAPYHVITNYQRGSMKKRSLRD